ncbi:D-arabinose 5-phosphate isomerase [Elizabethkingia meningoseptica]|uniref:KpsF/GutQ family sugar-phosphate isomerase n=1 Tax=Elizabethkingia meningoseptica TaxID=238 RepID=UPI000332BCBB|nr:KpsF/GutQ family sugar-phosphate isomerase [Elizabethkingia meningoseptica]AQX05555.1 D-arabinose 5-phosphate isomerase [Elizabethkingia meningoseptica]AQX47600.1 D-arabinose 5-phosphate isomerase [Elizabethkingia meningoseptica]EOR30426.1 putative sugar phosphate isomerase involved in capsule formation [Elizabethkingia meningoseptica ATCC 13253 = NBRC 12535]KUY24134.1 D-arabinose 5-phosphate isomerase [Elizabethkingia meningoseptica]MDE5489686.1 KpsF/GutQ family sugar-phosphate isomerase [
MKTKEILSLAQKTFSIEIQELEKTKNSLNESFTQAVEKIFETKGKLVVVGIGKSAHVANKIVATLNSTGTPAQFLHAAEAIHGDLGLLAKEDVVLCISNSGNSPEIVALAPILKNYSSCLIGMTGNPGSKLAESSDIVISSAVEQEACPNQLAPTSSTTVQMALGDALAVCLMELRDFKDTDFAKYHPGGSLGKNLTATVAQFLSDNKPEVHEDANIREIIISISASKHGITVVTNNKEITGVITDGDLRRMLMENEDVSGITAQQIMSRNPKTIDKNSLAKNAMEILKANNIGQLVVTKNKEYAGIIDIHTLLDEGII